MGEDAVEINNKLLEVIRPFVAKLRSIGILQNRDYRTVWHKSFDVHSSIGGTNSMYCI